MTVVIPTRNRPDMLFRLLRVFGTHDPDIQVVVVDDGSDRDSAEENSRICDRSFGWQYYYLPNAKGAAAARNVGLKKCESEFVWFIDDDDEVPKAAVQDVIEALKKTKGDVLLLPMRLVHNELVLRTVFPTVHGNVHREIGHQGHQVNTSCTVIRRVAVLQAGGWDETLVAGQDTSLFLVLARDAFFQCIKTEPVRVNIGHSNRITRKVFRQQYGKIQFLKKHWAELTWRRRIIYMVTFLFFVPAFLKLRIRWLVYLARKRRAAQ